MLELARVVAAHPESNAVDLYLMNSGRRVAGVQVMSGMAGGDIGLADLPSPLVTNAEDPYTTDNTERDIIAVVGRSNEFMIVIGFLFPQVAQCLFVEKNRRIYRHASDVYSTIDGSGNMELHHPSGTFFRVAETAPHQDLTGLDYDGIWKIDQNTDKLVHAVCEVRNGGNLKAKVAIDPDGNIVIDAVGAMTVTMDGNVSISSGGNMTLHADGNMALTADRIDLN